ncbi:MAG: type II toxin-antitoxin system YafQ family toxin [Spirochaetota bacterium]
MYIIQTTKRFEKDYRRIKKSGRKDIEKLKTVMRKLSAGEKLDSKYKEHYLSGTYKNRKECHIGPDWLLVYKIDSDKIIFERTGSHTELFK